MADILHFSKFSKNIKTIFRRNMALRKFIESTEGLYATQQVSFLVQFFNWTLINRNFYMAAIKNFSNYFYNTLLWF